jgi:outer membrane lipoprotein LolB
MRSRLSTLALCAIVLLLEGCVTPPETTVDVAPDPARWAAHQATMDTIHGWEAEGRVAADFAGDSASGSVTWSQSFDLVDFRFRGPFGFGGFQIQGDDERLRVRTSRGEDFILSDPIEDMRVQLGWVLPVRSMRYWILGVPAPTPDGAAAASLAFAPDGELVALMQDGWQVDLSDYQERSGYLLPRKVVMQTDGVELRFVIDTWAPELGDSAAGTE